ncbi:MAG: YbjQ family protein [Alphaproteobacteria bacterium]|nr:YbjQ family protein [Alphaproteobacteria bacterium]NCQ87734.1 YbjQ family protein [Alphaproteobacteria bacterium]NCT05757.1 YbjQ family protein [Alphaproteobacteria bacterium]
MIDLIIIFGFLFIAYITGSIAEKNHFKRIRAREAALINQPYVVDQFKTMDLSKAQRTEFVHGSCVIAADRFKMFLGGVLSIFGGRISAFESLTDRARREAIIRMREQAIGADMVVCTRIQFSKIGKTQVESIAYGTAIYLNSFDESVVTNSNEQIPAYTF